MLGCELIEQPSYNAHVVHSLTFNNQEKQRSLLKSQVHFFHSDIHFCPKVPASEADAPSPLTPGGNPGSVTESSIHEFQYNFKSWMLIHSSH